MRGQLVELAGGVGRLIVYMLILFAIVGAIVGAGLIDNTNPFWGTWNKIVSYGNTGFVLVGVGILVVIGAYFLRRFM